MQYRLIKRPNRKIELAWRERFTRKGKWVTAERRVSTGTTDEEEAKLFMRRWEKGIESPLDGSGILSVADVIQEYTIELRHRNTAASNMARHYSIVDTLNRHLGKCPYEKIKRSTGKEYVRTRVGEGVKRQTASRELSVLSAALEYCRNEEIIDLPSPVRFENHKPEVRERWLTQDEIDCLIENCDEGFTKLWTLIAVSTAARSGAILDLETNRVDIENDIIDFRNPKLTCRHKPRAAIKIPSKLKPYLIDAINKSRSGYIIEKNGRKLKAIYNYFQKAVKKSGLSGVTPHVLRHTCAVHMVKDGVPIYEVSKYLGHTNTRITEQNYARFEPDFMRHSSGVGSKLISRASSVKRVQL